MALPITPTPIRSMARSILRMAALATSATSTMTMDSMTALATATTTMEALATVSQGMPASADAVAEAMAAAMAVEVAVEATANRGAAAASPRSSDFDRQLEAPALRYEAVSDDLCRFDRYPPYLMMKRRETALFGAGLENPYFRVGDGVAGAEITVEGRRCINYASYNYLDFSGDRRVNEAAVAAIARYGTSVSASRLASGERPIHRELEAELAATLGTEEALVFVSGHATNVTVIGHLLGRKDLVLHDELIHNSVLQGCILSGAHRVKIAHNDWAAADAYLAAHRGKFERVLLVIEGIYSMDGDMPDLPRFIEVKRRHKAFLMIDEAHSFGVLDLDRARPPRHRRHLQHGRRHAGPAALHRGQAPPQGLPHDRRGAFLRRART